MVYIRSFDKKKSAIVLYLSLTWIISVEIDERTFNSFQLFIYLIQWCAFSVNNKSKSNGSQRYIYGKQILN